MHFLSCCVFMYCSVHFLSCFVFMYCSAHDCPALCVLPLQSRAMPQDHNATLNNLFMSWSQAYGQYYSSADQVRAVQS